MKFSRFAYALIFWVLSIPALIGSFGLFIDISQDFSWAFLLATIFAWLAFFVMTVGWIANFQVGRFWPIAGTAAGLTLTFTAAISYPLLLIYVVPGIALAGVVALYHMQRVSHA